MRSLFAVVLAAVLVAAGCGDDTNGTTSTDGTRIVKISMSEMAFDPSSFTFHVGETVTLRFTNNGTVTHEAVVGDEGRQKQHEDAALANPTGATGATGTGMTSTGVTGVGQSSSTSIAQLRRSLAHPGMNDPNAVMVEPGQSKDIVYSFAKPAKLIIGCHVVTATTTHWVHGMRATLEVVA